MGPTILNFIRDKFIKAAGIKFLLINASNHILYEYYHAICRKSSVTYIKINYCNVTAVIMESTMSNFITIMLTKDNYYIM